MIRRRFAKFQAAQGELSGALSRLMVVIGELSAAQVRPELPRSAGSARGHGEPHHRGAQPLHPGGAELQRHGAFVPRQFDRDDVRLQAEAEFHGRERSGDFQAADRGFLGACSGRRARRQRADSASAGALGAVPDARLAVGVVAVPRRAGRERATSPCRRSRHGSSDLTGTLSGGAVNRIEAKLADFEAKKGSQIAVLIVPTTQPEEIEQYGIRVAEQWKLGRKGVDDGAILLVAKNDRRVRIEVGYGLGGRAARRDRQSHHRGDHRAAFQAGRLRRRRRGRASIR